MILLPLWLIDLAHADAQYFHLRNGAIDLDRAYNACMTCGD